MLLLLPNQFLTIDAKQLQNKSISFFVVVYDTDALNSSLGAFILAESIGVDVFCDVQ